MFKITKKDNQEQVTYHCDNCGAIHIKDMSVAIKSDLFVCSYCRCVLPNVFNLSREMTRFNYELVLRRRRVETILYYNEPTADFCY